MKDQLNTKDVLDMLEARLIVNSERAKTGKTRAIRSSASLHATATALIIDDIKELAKDDLVDKWGNDMSEFGYSEEDFHCDSCNDDVDVDCHDCEQYQHAREAV